VDVYNIVQCSDNPNSPYNALSFNEIVLKDDKFVQIADPRWSVSNISRVLTPQCNYGGSLPNQVILTFAPPFVIF